VGELTASPNFPLKSAFQTALQGDRDDFLACLRQAGQIEGITALLILDD
jgi:hypothetical protein